MGLSTRRRRVFGKRLFDDDSAMTFVKKPSPRSTHAIAGTALRPRRGARAEFDRSSFSQ
jgi:hypothetical protein